MRVLRIGNAGQLSQKPLICFLLYAHRKTPFTPHLTLLNYINYICCETPGLVDPLISQFLCIYKVTAIRCVRDKQARSKLIGS